MQADADEPNYNLEVLREFRGKRYQESIDKNPKYVCKYTSHSACSDDMLTSAFLPRRAFHRSSGLPSGVYIHLSLHGQQVVRIP